MKKWFLLSLALAIIGALILGSCGNPPTPSPSPSPSPTQPVTGPKEILLGATVPLTGNLAGFGLGSGWGLRAAVNDINKTGGIFVKEYNRKIPVRLVMVDNLSDPIKAGTLAEDLILRDKVDFMVSGNESPPAFASTATVAEKYKTTYCGNVGPFEPYNAMRSQASPPWKYVWSTGFHIAAPASPGDFRYNKPGYTIMDLAATLVNQFGSQTNKRTAIFASDEPDGRGWYSTFPAALKGLGLDVLGADKELGMAPPNTTDFTAIIKQWKDYNCEIMFGNALAPWFGTLWRQCHELGFKPKLVYAGRAALYYVDINAWGGDLPWGVGCEGIWSASYDAKVCPGIGGTTPQSLAQRWSQDNNQPLNPALGWSYANVQIISDAIERAGTLDKDKVNAALAQTDLLTISNRVKYDEFQFSQFPLWWLQWIKTDKPYKWEGECVVSNHDFIPTTAKPLFPIPYP